MKTVTLDFAPITNEYRLHMLIKESLEFPEYYGCNLDALWDCLRSLETPMTIHIQGTPVFRDRLFDYAEKILTTFTDAANAVEGLKVVLE